MTVKKDPKNARARKAKISPKVRKAKIVDFKTTPPHVSIPEIVNPKALDAWIDLLVRARDLTKETRALDHYDRRELLNRGLGEQDPEIQLYLLRKAAGASAKDKVFEGIVYGLHSMLPTIVEAYIGRKAHEADKGKPMTDAEIEMLAQIGIMPVPDVVPGGSPMAPCPACDACDAATIPPKAQPKARKPKAVKVKAKLKAKAKPKIVKAAR